MLETDCPLVGEGITASRDALRCDPSGCKITMHPDSSDELTALLSFRKGEEKVRFHVSSVL